MNSPRKFGSTFLIVSLYAVCHCGPKQGISITSDPSGADVFKGRLKVGQTPYSDKTVTKISADFLVKKSGFKQESIRIELNDKIKNFDKHLKLLSLKEARLLPEYYASGKWLISDSSLKTAIKFKEGGKHYCYACNFSCVDDQFTPKSFGTWQISDNNLVVKSCSGFDYKFSLGEAEPDSFVGACTNSKSCSNVRIYR